PISLRPAAKRTNACFEVNHVSPESWQPSRKQPRFPRTIQRTSVDEDGYGWMRPFSATMSFAALLTGMAPSLIMRSAIAFQSRGIGEILPGVWINLVRTCGPLQISLPPSLPTLSELAGEEIIWRR